MEKPPYFIENFDHILFTTDVSFVIMPYLDEKLKGNSKNFHLEKNFKNFWVKIFFQNFLKFFFRYKSTRKDIFCKNFFQKILKIFFWNKIIFLSNEIFHYFLLIFWQGKAWLQNLHLLWIGYGQNFQWNMVLSPWKKPILYSCLWLNTL